MSEDVLSVADAELTPCEWHGHRLMNHHWHDTVDGYQRCANCKHVRQRPSTPAQELQVPPQRIVELSKLYLDVALNKEVGSDETRKAATDTVYALGELEQLRTLCGSER